MAAAPCGVAAKDQTVARPSKARPRAGGPVPLPSRPMPVANVTPQASAPLATAMSSWRLRRGSSDPSGEAPSRWRPRAASCAATIEPTAAAKASNPSAPTSSPASRAAAYANTPWPLAITTRMATADQGSTLSGRACCSTGSLSGGWSTPAVGCALALLAAVAGWSSERRASAAAAERCLVACSSVSSASARRLSSSMTWLATAVTLGSSRRAWNTSRARSCPSTRCCTGNGLAGFQERPALTADLASVRRARGLVGLFRDSTSR